jgi:hypothetical protein
MEVCPVLSYPRFGFKVAFSVVLTDSLTANMVDIRPRHKMLVSLCAYVYTLYIVRVPVNRREIHPRLLADVAK